MVVVRCLLLSSLLLLADAAYAYAYACGWWGDGEMSQNGDDILTPDGRPVEQFLDLKSMKLPGRMGYGVAVPEPGRVIPYLVATSGQPVKRIAEFKVFGFRSVIDLGTPTSTADLHRSETEAAGLQYFNIFIESNIPNRKQVELFNKLVIDAHNGPLLVYAPRAELLAVMWASYRLSLGAPLEFVLKEGRTLGLTREQEIKLNTP